MKKLKDKKVPVMFQKVREYNDSLTDTRFMDVKIWLMHLGENYNGSYFSKEAVEKAIPSLANTPILGYVQAKEDDSDFSDHRSIIVKKDGEYTYKYIGSAYGTIPETNNAQFEKRVGDDGIEREYLTVMGKIWRKNDEAVEIFERDTIKGQSMELHDDFEGEFKEDGLFHFTNFKFFGACALGDDVPPAMNSATIEQQFSNKGMHDYIQAKMEEFKKLVEMQKKDNCNSGMKDNTDIILDQNKGGNKMDREKLIAEFKKLLQANSVENEFGLKSYNSYYIDHNDTHLFTQSLDGKLVGLEYTVSDEEVVEVNFESSKPLKVEFTIVEEEVATSLKSSEIVEFEVGTRGKEVEQSLTTKFTNEKEVAVGEISVKLADAQSKFDALETEVKDLRTKLEGYTTKERQEQEEAIFAKFSKVFTDEDTEFVEVKAKASEYENLSELESTLYTLAGKKALSSFSAKNDEDDDEGKEKNKNVKIKVDFSEDLDVNPILAKHFGTKK